MIPRGLSSREGFGARMTINVNAVHGMGGAVVGVSFCSFAQIASLCETSLRTGDDAALHTRRPRWAVGRAWSCYVPRMATWVLQFAR